MKVKISDMMDYIEDASVDIREKEIASTTKIQEATMKKIEKEKSVTKCKQRKIPKVAAVTAALILSTTFAGSALAYIGWNGFAYTSEMSESEKEALLENNIAYAGEKIDADGNVHYLDENGNDIMVLSAEEAAEYEQKQRIAQEQAVQESTKLVNIYTLPLVPHGITEVTTDAEGRFEDFALGSGHMILLHPKDSERYSLKKEDSVTITLNDEEACILEFGMIKDGIVIETGTERQQNHEYSFEIKEDGEYNFYIMYYSANKGIFTDCMLTVK